MKITQHYLATLNYSEISKIEFRTSYLDLLCFWTGSWFAYADSGVYLAEKINRYLGDHWKSFASQNYFDRSGVFISVVWSGPLIFISIASVVSKLACPSVKVSFHCILLYLQFSWCYFIFRLFDHSRLAAWLHYVDWWWNGREQNLGTGLDLLVTRRIERREKQSSYYGRTEWFSDVDLCESL